MDNSGLALLRRKLEALSYTEPFIPESAALTQHLVNDVIQVTESYRGLKIQSQRKAQENEDTQSKVEVLKRENGRLASECNQLHQQLIQEAEQQDKLARTQYQSTKRLEAEIAELSFWKQQTLDRLSGMERENQGLKRQLQLHLHDHAEFPSGPLKDGGSSLRMSGALESKAGELHGMSRPSVDLLTLATARVQALETSLKQHAEAAEAVQQELKTCQDGIRRRDAEIARLGAVAQAGCDVDALSLQYRSQAQEEMILQLNQQADALGAQLAEASAAAEGHKASRTALKAAEHSKNEAEAKLRNALADNAAVAEEVGEMRLALMRLQSSNAPPSKPAKGSLDAALAKVLELNADRSNGKKGGQGALRKLMEAACAERDRSAAKQAQLQEEATKLRVVMEGAQRERDEARAAAEAARQAAGNQGQQGSQALQHAQAEAASAQAQLGDAQTRLATVTGSVQKLHANNESLQIQVQELMVKLAAAAAFSQDTQAQVAGLKAAGAELRSELPEAEHRVTALAAECESLQIQLKDAAQGKVRGEAQARALSAEAESLKAEAASLASELFQERERLAELAAERDSNRLEATRLRSQVEVAEGEKEILQQEAETAVAKLRSEREAMSQQQKRLAQMQHLPSHMQELQQQVQEYMTRLSDAERQAARHKLVASRAQQTQAQAERDVEDLRRAVDEAEVQFNAVRLKLAEADAAKADLAVLLKTARQDAKDAKEAGQSAEAALLEARESLDERSSETSESAAALRAKEHRITQLQRQLTSQENEVEGLRAKLGAAQKVAEGARLREDEARTQSRQHAERARGSALQVEHLEEELSNIRQKHEDLVQKTRELDTEASSLRREATARQKEVDQLRSLSVAGDATVQDCVAQLKHLATELRAAELRESELEAKVQQAELTLTEAQQQMLQLQQVIQDVDQQRDALQSELDVKAEAEDSLHEQLRQLEQHTQEATRELQEANGRVARAQGLLEEREQEMGSAADQLQAGQEQLQGLQEEVEGVKGENRAIAEDLEALVGENQVVAEQLARVTGERDEWQAEARQLAPRLQHAEALVGARESEVEDLRQAYEHLAVEKTQLEAGVRDLEREMVEREGQAAAHAADLAMLRDAEQNAQQQCNQYILELQAYERQVDVLSRQASRGQTESEDLDRERHSLLDRLRAAEQVRMQLENGRELQQRQMAGIDGQLHVMRARLQDAAAENQAIGHKLRLETGRVAELERLLAGMRAAHFKIQLEGQTCSDQAQTWQRKCAALESEVAGLKSQLQVAESQSWNALASPPSRASASPCLHRASPSRPSSHPAQVAEIAELQQKLRASEEEVEQLRSAASAAQPIASAQSSSPRDSPSPDRWGQATPDRASVTRARVKDLDARNARLHAELHAARSGAQQQAEAMQRTQSDLEHVKEENNRLIDLLSRIDLEKSHLQQALANIQSAPPPAPSTSQPFPSSGDTIPAIRRLGSGPTQHGNNSRPESTARSAKQELHSIEPPGAAFGMGGSMLQQLKADLVAEQARRKRAEQDFQALVETMEGTTA
ncbi:hypothetical protein WJX74_008759 [Apatococcus lobatus]|uniref:Uncharacterized protein n=1 Tax=Apatococcus lobatus TaxID=904363 RepID=A0AAW1RW51_9CHLO